MGRSLAKFVVLSILFSVLGSTANAQVYSTYYYVYTKDMAVGDAYTWDVDTTDLPENLTWAGQSLEGVSKMELGVISLPSIRGRTLDHDWFEVSLDGEPTNFEAAENLTDLGLYETSLFYPLYVSLRAGERLDFFTYDLNATRKGDFAQLEDVSSDMEVNLTWNVKTGLLEKGVFIALDDNGSELGRLSLSFDRPIRLSGAQWGMLLVTLVGLAITLMWGKRPFGTNDSSDEI